MLAPTSWANAGAFIAERANMPNTSRDHLDFKGTALPRLHAGLQNPIHRETQQILTLGYYGPLQLGYSTTANIKNQRAVSIASERKQPSLARTDASSSHWHSHKMSATRFNSPRNEELKESRRGIGSYTAEGLGFGIAPPARTVGRSIAECASCHARAPSPAFSLAMALPANPARYP